MKKILLGLGSLVSVIAPVAAVVSCGTKAAPTTPAPAAQPAATKETTGDGGNAAGGTQHNSGGSHHDSTFVPSVVAAPPTINRNPVAEPASYPVDLQVPADRTAPDVSTWGTVWFATYNPRTSSYEKKYSGSTYNGILDSILAEFKAMPTEGKTPKYHGLLRRSGAGKWAIWDIPTAASSETVAKLTELGITTDGRGNQYCFDSADDAIAFIKGLTNDLKAKLFNTLG